MGPPIEIPKQFPKGPEKDQRVFSRTPPKGASGNGDGDQFWQLLEQQHRF